MPKVVEVVPVMTEVEIEVPTQNDSTEGLANLYRGLEPAAMRLRSAAFSLLLISFLFCGTLEGLFGMAAADGAFRSGGGGVVRGRQCARSFLQPMSATAHPLRPRVFGHTPPPKRRPTPPNGAQRRCSNWARETHNRADIPERYLSKGYRRMQSTRARGTIDPCGL